MTGRDPMLPSPPVEAGPAGPSYRGTFSDDPPYGRDSDWTETQRIVVGVIVAVIAVVVLVLVLFVFSGPDEEPTPTVPITAAPAIVPTMPTTVSMAPPPSS
jgi:hypothetical protein